MYELYYSPGLANIAPHMMLEDIGAEHKLVLVPSQEWARVVLPLKSFARRPDEPVPSASEGGTTEETSVPAPGALGSTVTFEVIEDSDAEREMGLTRPVLDRVVSSE